MNRLMEPLCSRETQCKCCSAQASLYGVVDFHRDCKAIYADARGLSGIPIYYYRCPKCQFIFTIAFDHFTKEDFQQCIYNEDYLTLDPDYRSVRPRANYQFLCHVFAGRRPRRILDYGGGNGLLAELLRRAGFSQTDTYDPFVPRYAAKPQHRYDCIVSFEVVEHSTDPARTFAEMNDLLMDPGIILFSTLLQPANLDQLGLNWWYAGPRNGHVSLYTKQSLEALVRPHQLKLVSLNEGVHALYRDIPDFAKSLIPVA